MEKEKAREVLKKTWDKLDNEQRKEFLVELTDEELTLLEDSLWDEKTTKEAAKTLTQEFFSFKDQETRKIKKSKLISIFSGGILLGSLGSILDLGITGITGGAVTGGVLSNIGHTMMEEDGASRRIGRGIKRSFSKVFRRSQRSVKNP